MDFTRANVSPIGGQSRAGVVPQVFSHVSLDSLAMIKAPGYFPINSTDPKLNMLGVLKPNDWILVHYDDVFFVIIFILNDGSDGNPITTHAVEIHAS